MPTIATRNAESRECPKCREVKGAKEFASPRNSYCRPCWSEYQRDYRRAHPEQRRKIRRGNSLAQYKLTEESFLRILRDQGNGCAICGTTEPGLRGWFVDHDHTCCSKNYGTCGTCVRGVLCPQCNFGLGQFGDDPARLRAAADYIDRNRVKG